MQYPQSLLAWGGKQGGVRGDTFKWYCTLLYCTNYGK